MISICIPVYNFNVTNLVTELHRQAEDAGMIYEILLLEDASTHFLTENAALQNLSGVQYRLLEQNVGRAKIRNLLADWAKYPNLLFLDCDTLPPDSQYISRYLQTIPADIVVGGTGYPNEPPKNPDHLLRWQYGVSREVQSAAKRNQQPNRSFSTFNFLIKKEILQLTPFDETLSGYGHEDTWLGWQLKQQHLKIRHIDNPLLHLPDEPTERFLQNTTNALQNLWQLYQKTGEQKEFAKDNRLLLTILQLQKYHLTAGMSFLFRFFRNFLLQNLRSTHPNMRYFDLFRLGILNEIARKTERTSTKFRLNAKKTFFK